MSQFNDIIETTENKTKTEGSLLSFTSLIDQRFLSHVRQRLRFKVSDCIFCTRQTLTLSMTESLVIIIHHPNRSLMFLYPSFPSPSTLISSFTDFSPLAAHSSRLLSCGSPSLYHFYIFSSSHLSIREQLSSAPCLCF